MRQFILSAQYSELPWAPKRLYTNTFANIKHLLRVWELQNHGNHGFSASGGSGAMEIVGPELMEAPKNMEIVCPERLGAPNHGNLMP